MPADGRISQLGQIEKADFPGQGQSFTTAELLASPPTRCPSPTACSPPSPVPARLPPRAHAVGRHLRETVHVPGRLFSVGPDAVRNVPRLFARNERLVCHFDTDFGPMVQVMVGAMLVSGVETVWSGVEIPAYADRPIRKDWRGKGIRLERFAEMARFNYGSTVIVLPPAWPSSRSRCMPNRQSNSGSGWPRSKADPATSTPGRVATRRAARRPQDRGRAARSTTAPPSSCCCRRAWPSSRPRCMPNRRSNSGSGWPRSKADPATSTPGRVATRLDARHL
jgi:hypothetical protein